MTAFESLRYLPHVIMNHTETFFVSSFTPGNSFTSQHSSLTACSTRISNNVPTAPLMLGPKHVRRTEEIERLTKQLEQLRAKRSAILSKSQSSSAPPAAQQNSSPSSPTSTSSSSPSPSSPDSSSSSFQLGKHSDRSRFLSISSVDGEEHHPRALLVAGFVSELTTEQFLKVPPMLYNKEPTKGNLFLCRIPEGFTGDFITMSTFDVLARCGDPVALLMDPDHLSATQLPISPGDDVVLVVDRDMSEHPFNSNHFYAWDVNGKVDVGWSDYEPPANVAKRIGKVVFGHIEINKELRNKKSCWEEENETYQ